MAGAMRSDLPDGSPVVYAAVEIHDEVITDVAPAVAFRFRRGMPFSDLLHGEMLPLRGCRAMHNDFVYASHNLMGIVVLGIGD